MNIPLIDTARKKQIELLVREALSEDLGEGDRTNALFPSKVQGQWMLRSRQEGVFCGREVLNEILKQSELAVKVINCVADGSTFEAGETLCRFEGNDSLLSIERVILNFLQHLSAVATETGRWLKAVEGTSCAVFDTRKTTPAWRHLERQAVAVAGGGHCRHGLYDAVMIKDNHLARAGQPSGEALTQFVAGAVAKSQVPVIVEVETVEDALSAAAGLPSALLLDNMNVDELSRCVKEIHELENRPLLEASGGLTIERAREVAETGVDRISTGALTQSPPRIDLGLDAL